MKNIIIFCCSLRGGIFEEAYYDFIDVFAKAYNFKTYDKSFFKLKSSWNKKQIIREIHKKIEGYDNVIIIGNSIGAQIAEHFIGFKNIDIYYVCPALGLQVLNLPTIVKILSPLLRILCNIYILLSFPFRHILSLPIHPSDLDRRTPYSRHAFVQQIEALLTLHSKEYKIPKGIITVKNDQKVETAKLYDIFPRQIIFAIENGKHSNFRYDGSDNREQFKKAAQEMVIEQHT